ncbi:MAG: hypothetical protein E7591_02050 [Ruminococcaceae bacterium]|nr:hypothetical protein [Oscillospiraceae bacterium]
MFNFRKTLKRTISTVLVCVTLMLTLPLTSSAAITTYEITQAMTSLKNNAYPQNNYWCGGNPSASLPYSGCGKPFSCFCNNFNGSYQCHGFALCVAQRTMGSYPAVRLLNYSHGAVSGPWTCYTKSALGTAALCALELRPGDIVRASDDSAYQSGHTAIVWKVENGKVYFAEAWGSVYNKINWGGFNYASYSMSAICAKYPYVALWRNKEVINADSCLHQTVEKHDEAHPHRVYTECTLCNEISYTGTYFKEDECPCCSGNHEYTLSNEEPHPHYEIKTCALCNDIIYTGEVKKDYSCAQCLGLPYDMKVTPSSLEAVMGESITVSFGAEDAVQYSLTLKLDGKKVVETAVPESNEYSFTLTDVGSYTVTLWASSEDGKTNSVISEPIVVKAPISEVKEENSVFTLKYPIALSEEQAGEFTSKRGLTLRERTEEYFTAEFTLAGKQAELYEDKAYVYYPIALSYYEIKDFCALTGRVMAYSASKEENDRLTVLITKAASPGILLDATDCDEEGVWHYGEDNQITYTNWHESYTAEENPTSNYLMMYPGGKWIDSPLMPEYGHGFVAIEDAEFGYTENEDNTLTITSVPVKNTMEMVIPSQIGGKTVTALADLSLAHAEIGYLTIPGTITHISDNAFAYADIQCYVIYRDWALADLFTDGSAAVKYLLPFKDVLKTDWYYKSLDYCYNNSYITGTSRTEFSPSLTCTREQFLTVLARVMKADLSLYEEASSFTDVIPGEWYSAAVEWGYKNNITQGIGEGIFGIGEPVTRQQIAVLLSNLHEKGEQTEDLSRFSDAEDISDWAQEGMKWAVAEGIMSGTSKGTLEPKRVAKRTELCQMIYNYCIIFEN